MADGEAVHISSAVVRTRPERAAEVAERLALMPGVEVAGEQGGKIIVVLEGPDSGTLGARVAEMALMDGVFGANLVYERIETPQSLGEAT